MSRPMNDNLLAMRQGAFRWRTSGLTEQASQKTQRRPPCYGAQSHCHPRQPPTPKLKPAKPSPEGRAVRQSQRGDRRERGPEGCPRAPIREAPQRRPAPKRSRGRRSGDEGARPWRPSNTSSTAKREGRSARAVARRVPANADPGGAQRRPAPKRSRGRRAGDEGAGAWRPSNTERACAWRPKERERTGRSHVRPTPRSPIRARRSHSSWRRDRRGWCPGRPWRGRWRPSSRART